MYDQKDLYEHDLIKVTSEILHLDALKAIVNSIFRSACLSGGSSARVVFYNINFFRFIRDFTSADGIENYMY